MVKERGWMVNALNWTAAGFYFRSWPFFLQLLQLWPCRGLNRPACMDSTGLF